MQEFSREVMAEPLVAWLRAALESADGPVYVALDGRSGVGKSTVAATVKLVLADADVQVAVIEGDQFYAGGSSATWDARSAEDKVANVMDWRRQHQVLADLRNNGSATWHSFGWEATDWDADPAPLDPEPISMNAADIVILEGAYSARPELHELLDLLVLLNIPTDVRRQQLLDREGASYREDWERRWSEAEDLYFGQIMTPDRFDLVLSKHQTSELPVKLPTPILGVRSQHHPQSFGVRSQHQQPVDFATIVSGVFGHRPDSSVARNFLR